MNAANYNWTEPINRASDKPGEIHYSPECVKGKFSAKLVRSTLRSNVISLREDDDG